MCKLREVILDNAVILVMQDVVKLIKAMLIWPEHGNGMLCTWPGTDSPCAVTSNLLIGVGI